MVCSNVDETLTEEILLIEATGLTLILLAARAESGESKTKRRAISGVRRILTPLTNS